MPLAGTTGGRGEAVEGLAHRRSSGTVTEAPAAAGRWARRDDRRRQRPAPARRRLLKRSGRRARRDRRPRHGDRSAGAARQQRHGRRRLSAPRHATRRAGRPRGANAEPTPTPTPTPPPTPTPTPTPTSPRPRHRCRARLRRPHRPRRPRRRRSRHRSRSRWRGHCRSGRPSSVGGVVTAEGGRLGTPALIAIAGLHRPGSSSASLTARGRRAGRSIEVRGALADPYGQLEVRSLSSVRVAGAGALPPAVLIDGSTLGEAVEGRLVTLTGTVKARPAKASSGDITFDIDTAGGTGQARGRRVGGHRPATISAGDRLRVTGVAGQRASRKGAPDGYRVWLRDSADVVPHLRPGPIELAEPDAERRSSSSPGTGIVVDRGRDPDPERQGRGRGHRDGRPRRCSMRPAGGSSSRTGRRRSRSSSPPARRPHASAAGCGSRARSDGRMARRASARRSSRSFPVARQSHRSSCASHRVRPTSGAWSGFAATSSTSTSRALAGEPSCSSAGNAFRSRGLAGARIPATAIVEGRTATLVGIVRRPYPVGDRPALRGRPAWAE